MTGAKVKQVLQFYLDHFRKEDREAGLAPVEPRKMSDADALRKGPEVDDLAWGAHLHHMCVEAQEFVDEGRVEKAMRWLGFLQGVLWESGEFSLDDLKNHSRPDGGAGDSCTSQSSGTSAKLAEAEMWLRRTDGWDLFHDGRQAAIIAAELDRLRSDLKNHSRSDGGVEGEGVEVGRSEYVVDVFRAYDCYDDKGVKIGRSVLSSGWTAQDILLLGVNGCPFGAGVEAKVVGWPGDEFRVEVVEIGRGDRSYRFVLSRG